MHQLREFVVGCQEHHHHEDRFVAVPGEVELGFEQGCDVLASKF